MRCSQLTKLSMEPTPYDELAHSSKLININNNKLNINNINKLNINNNNNDFSFFDSTDTKGQFSTLKDLDVKTNTPVDDLTGESSLKSGATPLIAKLVTLLLWIVTGGTFIKTFATKTLKTKYAQAVSGVLYATFSALLLLHSAATDVHRRFCSTISATVRLRLVLPLPIFFWASLLTLLADPRRFLAPTTCPRPHRLFKLRGYLWPTDRLAIRKKKRWCVIYLLPHIVAHTPGSASCIIDQNYNDLLLSALNQLSDNFADVIALSLNDIGLPPLETSLRPSDIIDLQGELFDELFGNETERSEWLNVTSDIDIEAKLQSNLVYVIGNPELNLTCSLNETLERFKLDVVMKGSVDASSVSVVPQVSLLPDSFPSLDLNVSTLDFGYELRLPINLNLARKRFTLGDTQVDFWTKFSAVASQDLPVLPSR